MDTQSQVKSPKSGLPIRAVILTQPLGLNYGGILQAFALQTVVRELGASVATNVSPIQTSLVRSLLRGVRSRLTNKVGPAELSYLSSNLQDFINRNMETVDLFKGKKRPDWSRVGDYDLFIAGSDQIWRAAYSDVPRHLLDFVPGGKTKISYAASFGTDNLDEYSDSLVRESARLAQSFDAISVRERHGVDICREKWGLIAENHVDPTLLIERNTWQQISTKNCGPITNTDGGALLTYILDPTAQKNSIVSEISTKLNLDVEENLIQIPNTRREFYSRHDTYKMIPVEQWLRSFSVAKFIVTDSFHGVVFAIIFNKPFIVIGNESRGLSRFHSLLDLFDLSDRLIVDGKPFSDTVLETNIDWVAINSRISSERDRGISYLRKFLLG